MLDLNFIILLLIFLLAVFFILSMFFRHRKQFHDVEEFESNEEEHEYSEKATFYNKKFHKSEDEETEDETEGDDRRDIYNKKTEKNKKKPYQVKSYRGTDIEIAGFEDKKDLKELHRDDLPTLDTEDLDFEIAKEEPEEEKPVEIAKEIKKSGIASQEDAMATTTLEVDENYRAKGESSALNNLENSVKAVKKSMEDKHKGHEHDKHGNEKHGGITR